MNILRPQWCQLPLHRPVSMLLLTLALITAPPAPLHATDNSFTTSKAPGKLVKTGKHRLHILCKGVGSPTVIMDSGLGGSSLEWYRLQQRLATDVQTCIYDRAGYGWSEAGPFPRTSSQIADELYLLLHNADIPGPYVLVGHSFGGYNMQLFASRYPYLTAGMVLVDSSHPQQVQRFLAPPIGLKTTPSIQGEIVYVRFGKPQLHPNLAEELKATVKTFMMSRRTRTAIGSEYLNFRLSAEQVQQAGPLPKVPLVVLTRGLRVWPRDLRGDLIEQLWLDMQGELAQRSPYSAQIVAEQSEHYIHLDQPQLVTDSVFLVVRQARRDNATVFMAPEFPGMFERSSPLFRDALWVSDRLTNMEHALPDQSNQASLTVTPVNQ